MGFSKTQITVLSMGCCALISLNLFLVSLLSPGWLVFNDFNNMGLELHMGLFYFNQCVKKMCTSEMYDEFIKTLGEKGGVSLLTAILIGPGEHDFYEEYLAEMIVSIVIMLFACCFVFLYVRIKSPGFMAIPIILLLIPGILVWVATGRWIYYEYYTRGDMGIPYCLILNGVGATLCFIIIFILIVVMLIDWNKKSKNDRRVLVTRQEPVSVSNPRYVYEQPQEKSQILYY